MESAEMTEPDARLRRVCSVGEVDGGLLRSEVWTMAGSPDGDLYLSMERSKWFRVSLHVSGQFHMRLSPDGRRRSLVMDHRFTPTLQPLGLRRAVQLRIPVATIRHDRPIPEHTTVLLRQVEHDLPLLVDLWLAPTDEAEALLLSKRFGYHIDTLPLDGTRRVLLLAYYMEVRLNPLTMPASKHAEFRAALDGIPEEHVGGMVSGLNPDNSLWLSHMRVGRIEDEPHAVTETAPS